MTNTTDPPVFYLLSASEAFSVRTGLLLVASLLELPSLNDSDRRLCIAELKGITDLLERHA